MTTTEIAGIVAKLTKAQREALLWCDPSRPKEYHSGGAPREVSFYAIASVLLGDPKKEIARTYSLVRRGVGQKAPGQIWPSNTWTLTPLGISVRAALQEAGE